MNFSDPADLAEHQQSRINQLKIDAIRSKGRELHPRGTCHYCEEVVQKPRLFCDADCGTDYERTKK